MYAAGNAVKDGIYQESLIVSHFLSGSGKNIDAVSKESGIWQQRKFQQSSISVEVKIPRYFVTALTACHSKAGIQIC